MLHNLLIKSKRDLIILPRKNIFYLMKFHCYSSHQIDNRGLLIKLVNFTLLSLDLFGYIDTFPGG